MLQGMYSILTHIMNDASMWFYIYLKLMLVIGLYDYSYYAACTLLCQYTNLLEPFDALWQNPHHTGRWAFFYCHHWIVLYAPTFPGDSLFRATLKPQYR